MHGQNHIKVGESLKRLDWTVILQD